jgi:hypothetical protein
VRLVAAEHADELRRTFETLTDRLREDISRHFRHFDETAREFTSALEQDLAGAVDQDSSSGVRRLKDAFARIDAATSLSDVLDAIHAAALAEAPFAIVWLVDGDRLRPWASGGATDAHGSADIAIADAGFVGDVIYSGASAWEERSGRAPSFDAGRGRASKMAAVPIAVGGDVVAVVYVEDPPDHSPFELIVRYASRCLEVITAIKLASLSRESFSVRHAAPVIPFSKPLSMEDGTPEHLGDVDGNAAQRYARLLVSEIKFYHEAEVVEGCRERDLMTRLGGEIARARGFYEQRIPEGTRRRVDYFHNELVRTLADGDDSLVGPSALDVHAAE